MKAQLAMFVLLGVVPAMAGESPCGSSPEGTRASILALVQSAYGGHGLDAEGAEYARQGLLRDKAVALPCLLGLYREGLAGTGLWTSEAPTPTDARWVLQLIEQLDPAEAIVLYTELAATLPSPERVAILAKLVLLGVDSHRPELLAFLDSVPDPGSDLGSQRAAVRAVLDVLSATNFQPALARLKHLQARGEDDDGRLPIYVAQLEGNLGALRDYAEASPRWAVALIAMERMGAAKTLRELAEDSRYAHRAAAAARARNMSEQEAEP